MKNRVIKLKPKGLIIKQTITKVITISGAILLLLIAVNSAWLFYAHNIILKDFGVDSGKIEALQSDNRELQIDIDNKQEALDILKNDETGISLSFLEAFDKFSDITVLSIKTTANADEEDDRSRIMTVTGSAAKNESVSLLVNELSSAPFVKDFSLKGLEEVLTASGTKQLFELEITLF